jgi:hypothetical protein
VILPRAIVGLAVAWCVAFPLVGLSAQLHLFADGGVFAYAVAAGDAWDFHWRQISGRVAAYALASLPGEAWGRITGDPAAGVALYAALWFAAPAVGLAATWLADRTRVLRLWAALSTALLLPVVFGFPTELWIAHAAFWPALALCWSPGGRGRALAAGVALAVLVLSHEGGVVWAVVLLGALLLAPARGAALRRAVLALVPSLAVWVALRLLVPPDPYVAEVLGSNAANFLDVSSLFAPLPLTIAGALLVYLVAWLPRRDAAMALGIAVAALAPWWLLFDTTLHAWDRYFLRTLLLGAVPGLAVLAALHAGGWLAPLLARARPWAGLAAGALVLASLVHAVETAKFAQAWRGYMAVVAALAASAESDLSLGDDAFISTARVPRALAALGWKSTTPFLSVMVSEGFAPARLLVDARAGYVWFDCEAATRNAAAERALPVQTREMVRRYACLRRP